MNLSKISILLVTIACLALSAVTSSAAAQDEPKKGKRKKADQAQAITQLLKKVESAEPTAEQKEKLKALAKEYTPKFLEVTKKLNESLPEDLRKKKAAARKELQSAGTKGKQLAAALAEKVPLTEEQKKASQEANAARNKLQAEFTTKVTEILTPEQVTKAGIKIPKTKKSA